MAERWSGGALPAALLLLGLLALLLPSLGSAPLERAEIYFLDAARGMVESGDWVVPRYQGEPFFDKPPLVYWLMAGAFSVLGTEPGVARLVPALSGLGAVLATVWLGALLFDRRTALAGAVIFSTTLAFLTFARVAMSDMLLTLLTTLAVAVAVRAWGPGPPPWAIPTLGAILGLGFATKGPIAILVPALAVLVLLVQNRRRPLPFGLPGIVLGSLVFAVLGLGWFALIYARLGAAPLGYFFFRENLQRFAGEAFDVGRSPWFYLPAYVAEGLPWSLFLPLALWRGLSPSRENAESHRPARFLALWVGLVLLPLCLSRGKVDYYLLPLYPAVSLLIGRWFVAVPWGRLDRAWVRAVLLLFAVAVAFAILRPPQAPAAWLPGRAALGLLATTLALGALAAVAVVRRPLPGRTLAVLSLGMASSWLVLVIFFLPAFTGAQPNRTIARDVARERRYQPDLRLATCSDPARARRDVLFHARVTAEERCDLWPLVASPAPYLLLVGPDEDRSFRSTPGYRHVASYRYLPARALTLGGLLSPSEPGALALVANFPTEDPVAARKKRREYRKSFKEARRAQKGRRVRQPEKRRR